MSAVHTPGPRLRKPNKTERDGLSLVRNEMATIADDLRTYRDAEERKRARQINAALDYIDAAIAKATGRTS